MSAMKPGKKLVVYSLPESWVRALKHLAVDLGISVNTLMLNLIETYLETKKKEGGK